MEKLTTDPSASRWVFRFSLRALLIAFIGFAIGLVFLPKAWNLINGDFDDIVRGMHAVPNIHDVEIRALEQVGNFVIDAQEVTFRISGKPDSWITVSSPKPDIFERTSHIGLVQISDMQVCVSSYNSHGELIGGGFVDIGPASPLRRILPFSVSNIEELISRYDELEAHFRQWPIYPDVGRLEISSDTTFEYYRH